MDSSDEEPIIDDEDVLCKYGTALTPYEAGKSSEKRECVVFRSFHNFQMKFRRKSRFRLKIRSSKTRMDEGGFMEPSLEDSAPAIGTQWDPKTVRSL